MWIGVAIRSMALPTQALSRHAARRPAFNQRGDVSHSYRTVIKEVTSMQRFVAELSTAIEEADFERSWCGDQSLNNKQPKVKFTFNGRRVSAVVDPDSLERWASSSFYRTFSAAVRRVDQACNVRWL
jgi:hypothetical protein